MSLKSISPFIASVLLIGFTIASGIIVYYFLTTLPKVQTTEVSSQASKVLSCAGATFDVKVRNCNLLNGLVLWLPMDEGSGTIAYDYSGYGNNGTLYSGYTICSNPPTSGCPTWVDGKIGKALSFDGVNDYVRISESPSLKITRAITIEAWVYPTKVADLWQQIVGKRDANNIGGYLLQLTASNRFIFYIYSGGWRWIYATTLPANNTWFHVLGTFDGSSLKIYVNGNLEGTIPFSGTINDVTSDVSIGNSYAGSSEYFNGIVDEVRIYNRALSEEEIKELYYNGLTNKFNITIGLLNFGYADLGKSFNAIVYLRNGTILQLPLTLDRDLTRGSYLEKTLTIDDYYPSYGLVDKIMVCSNYCQGVGSEIIVNNQC
jgi:hypothetical protein